jgi:ribosome-binding ATPase YchF (GTP1/OBG family)
MITGLIGAPYSGKSTVFRLLLGGALPHKGDIGVVAIPDARLTKLAGLYKPRKIVPATLEVRDCPSTASWTGEGGAREIAELRNLDSLCIALGGPNLTAGATLAVELQTILGELHLADQIVLEGKEERLHKELPRAKPDVKIVMEQEAHVVKAARQALESGDPSILTDLGSSAMEKLKGFALFLQKPKVAVVNLPESMLEDRDVIADELHKEFTGMETVAFDAALELELSQLSPEEQEEMRAAYGITESAASELAAKLIAACRLIHFFTVGDDEVRAWEVPTGITAQKAAGVIHSDLERGFIRADVCQWDALLQHGGWAGAKAAAAARTEGRDYIVKDGDVMLVRHSG